MAFMFLLALQPMVSSNLAHWFLALSASPFYWYTFLTVQVLGTLNWQRPIGCSDPVLAIRAPSQTPHKCVERNREYSLLFVSAVPSGRLLKAWLPKWLNLIEFPVYPYILAPLYTFSLICKVFTTLHECPSSLVLCFLPLGLFIGSSHFFFQPLLRLAKQTLLIVPH